MYSPHGLYDTIIRHNNSRESSYMPHDGLLWPKHFAEFTRKQRVTQRIQPIMYAAALKTAVCVLSLPSSTASSDKLFF
jgi:hypothetical protein